MKKLTWRQYRSLAWRFPLIVALVLVGFTLDVISDVLREMSRGIERWCKTISDNFHKKYGIE